MCRRCLSLNVLIILATLFSYTKSSMLTNSQSQFNVKVEKNKAFKKPCLIGTFEITGGNIAECLKHCLENCLCQSFQICQNTVCQLCSSNMKDNSSLLYTKDSCIYAMYETQRPIGTSELNEQCSGNCLMKYNCCQQPDVCPKNKICKPINSLVETWKRFTCECPEGYHGDQCDEPIMSCKGYSKGSRKSGIYKVLGSDKSVYEVYCYFDSHGAWTLVQSYSFANGTNQSQFQEFLKPLTQNRPVSENSLDWSGYRLSKARMQSIESNSDHIRFTCDYEKNDNFRKLDFIQIPLKDLDGDDILEPHSYAHWDSNYHGKIGEVQFNRNCPFLLSLDDQSANMHVTYGQDGLNSCNFKPTIITTYGRCSLSPNYFGNYDGSCLDEKHRCSSNNEATTQLWFRH